LSSELWKPHDSLLRDALDKTGIEYTHISAVETYAQGLFNDRSTSSYPMQRELVR